MDRSNWSALSRDSEIWKKVAMGAGSLLLLLPTPLALGIINVDLEAEVQRRAAKEPPLKDGSLPSVDDLSKLVMGGIGPTLLYVAALVMFAIPTVPLLLSGGQLYAYFKPPSSLVPELANEIHMPFTSLIMYFVIALIALALQAVIAASFPVAMAQYSRGKDLRPALAVIPNAITVVEMGFSYWLKVSGLVLAGFLMLLSNLIGLAWYINLPLCFAICAMAFVSLVLSSRHALEHVSAEIKINPLPIPDADNRATLD